VRDAAAACRGQRLVDYLQAACGSGRLDEFRCVDIDLDSGGPDPDRPVAGVGACGLVVQAAVKARLGRRDAVMAVGGERIGRVAAVAAASFRRYTMAVRIHHDLAAIVSCIRDGLRAALDGEPIAAATRRTHVLVDEDGVCSAPPGHPEEHLALLALALLDRHLLERLNRAGVESCRGDAVSAVLRLCRLLGPGHPAWRMGDAWLPLAPAGWSNNDRQAWALVTATWVACRLGLLPPAVLGGVEELADQLGLRPGPRRVDAASAHRWLAGWPPGDVTVVLPTEDGDGVPVTVDRGALSDAVAGLVAADPRTRAGQSRPMRSAGPRRLGSIGPATRMHTLMQLRLDASASFPIRFAEHVLDPDTSSLPDLLPSGCRVLAVVDPYEGGQLDRVLRLLAAYRDRGRLAHATVMPVTVTEHTKNMDQVAAIVHTADGLGLGAEDRLIAIGGGMLMDVAGYAAYLYHRATPYIRVPTTLVGMIDAGIGLKVGVNLEHRKNLLGAYHPPLACLCDVAFLNTLPVAERRCGLAEAIKIAMVCDAHLFTLIEQHHTQVLAARDSPQVREILNRSITSMLCQLVANPVEEDPRRLPDFGHEFGHALESMSGYRLRHGEAVAIGMALSSQLAFRAGYLAQADLARLLTLIGRTGLSVADPVCAPDLLWRRLADDVVAHKAGKLHLVVPAGIGVGAFIDSLDEISVDMIRDACTELRAWHVDGVW